MAKKAKKQTTRGRKQDRARVAGGQKYEVSYEFEEDRALRRVGQKSGQEGRKHA